MKRKIVRVFEVDSTTQPQKPVLEAGLLSKIAGAVKGKKTPPPQEPEDDGDEHGLKGDNETSVQQILGRIFSIPSDSRRAVLFLNDADLKSRYLTKSGPENISTHISDDVFTQSLTAQNKGELTFLHTDRAIFKKNDSNFSEFRLDEITGSEIAMTPYAVLFNIKKNVWAEFEGASDIQSKRAALAKCIDHKFYVAVLNGAAIKKAGLDKVSEEEMEDKFQIKKFLTAYPVRAVLDAAKEEQEETFSQSEEEEDKKIVDAVVKKAVKYVYKKTTNGKLSRNVSKANFEKGLLEILEDSDELEDREELRGQVLNAFLGNKSLLDGNLGNLLSFISASSSSEGEGDDSATAVSSKATGSEGITSKDLEDLTPDEIMHKLASRFGRGHPELKAAQKKWGLL